MLRRFLFLFVLLITQEMDAQENIAPAPAQSQPILLQNATIHIGNGQVVDNADLLFADGKIISISPNLQNIPSNTIRIDCKSKHIYPGLIAPATALGLIEVAAVRATNDTRELGPLNPEIRSIVAYNTDSRVINTIRSNGILLANIVPQGELLCGSSSVVQLDAWNWEDAVIHMDHGMHLRLPRLMQRKTDKEDVDIVKNSLAKIDSVIDFFSQAKNYQQNKANLPVSIKFDAAQKLLNGKQKLFVHASTVKEMLMAISIANKLGVNLVIVGGEDSYLILDELKKHKVEIILQSPHSLPTTSDDPVDQPYKTASLLAKSGITYSLYMNDEDAFWQIRNLPFLAGTTAAYGVSKEDALKSITLNAAKILGIDQSNGSLEIGKDATLVVSEGDILDMSTSKIIHAFIQGRKINLDNKQTQLYNKFKKKYNLN